MTWLLIGVLIWVALAVPLAIVIGRGIRLADSSREAEVTPMPGRHRAACDTDGPGEPWTGPSTVPFAPSRTPWGGDRTSAQPRPHVVRNPVRPTERDPGVRDPGSA